MLTGSGWVRWIGFRVLRTPEALRAAMVAAGPAPMVVLEATYGWYWAVETLQQLGAEIHLAHPLGIKGFSYRRVKNDERDAADLADLLRMGRSAKSSVHAVLAKRGVVVGMSDRSVRSRGHRIVGSILPGASPTPRCTAVGSRNRATRSCGGPRSKQCNAAPSPLITAHRTRIADRRGRPGRSNGRNIAKVAAARVMLKLVFYGLRDGHIRALDRPTDPLAARGDRHAPGAWPLV
jgi:hypothetical protein